MNDIFDLRRFGRYAYKQYRERCAKYTLAAIVGVVVFAILLYPPKLFDPVEVFNESSIYDNFIGKLYSLRALMCFFFIILLNTNNREAIVENRVIKRAEGLLPISAFEQFTFMVLNPIIVGSIAYFIIVDPIITAYIESHIFIDGYNVVTMPLINKSGYMLDTLKYSNINIDTIPFVFKPSSTTLFTLFGYNVFIYSSIFLLCIAYTWCEISFKRPFLGALMHVAIFMFGSFCYHHIKIHTQFFDSSIAKTLLPLLPLLLVLIYTYSAYKKFKRLPIN